MATKKTLKTKKTDESRAVRALTVRLAALERQLKHLQGGPATRNTAKRKAEPKKTVGAKVSKHLAIFWAIESKRRQMPMSVVITEALIEAYGVPDDE